MGFLREMFGSGLGTDDPRAVYIEAMVAAIDAGGQVTEAETDRLHELLERHDAFAALPREARETLVDQAADAIESAGGWRARVATYATALPSHEERVTAYCLAAEVSVAGGTLPAGKITYLEALQSALGLPDAEAKELFESVRKRSSVLTLEERAGRVREMVPKFLDAMVLLAQSDGKVDDTERAAIARVVQRMVSRRAFGEAAAKAAIDAAFQRIGTRDAASIIADLGRAVSTSVDRFWVMTSLMVVALADGKKDWKELGVLARCQDALGLESSQMDQAMELAARIHKEGALA